MTIVPSDLCILADKIYFETKLVYKVIVKVMPSSIMTEMQLMSIFQLKIESIACSQGKNWLN